VRRYHTKDRERSEPVEFGSMAEPRCSGKFLRDGFDPTFLSRACLTVNGNHIAISRLSVGPLNLRGGPPLRVLL
jgi:hypothetical protein